MSELPPPRYGERVTSVGTAPPPPALVKPPKKWLGRRGGLIILGGFAAVWLYLMLFGAFVEHGLSLTGVMLGGFALASALIYTMAYRLRAQDGITVTRLLLAFLIGGVISTVLASTFDYITNYFTGGTSLGVSIGSLSLAGVVEELCKIVAVIIVSRKLANKSARNGLFIGGAVGLGFSAIEDMLYQTRSWDFPTIAHSPLASIVTITVSRDLIGPFEHPIYTALFAAALFAASRNGRFRLTPSVIGAYLAVALVHGLVDSSAGWLSILLGNKPLGTGLGFVFTLVLAFISWFVWFRISRRLRNRLRANEPAPTERPPGEQPTDATPLPPPWNTQ